ncbi:hypothetical protein FM036_06830 [Nostoc sp. HG1]|nr:hypothetical protein [Nostoc sp. HG1]
MGLKPHPKEFKRVKIAIPAIAISTSCFLFWANCDRKNGETTVRRIAGDTKRIKRNRSRDSLKANISVQLP